MTTGSAFGPGFSLSGQYGIPSSVHQMRSPHPFWPTAWIRSWVTSLGHDAKIFTKNDADFPGASSFQKLLVGGIQSAMGMKPFCQ